MALPPEQINIKRRREEEPPETLYIQSQLHQTKRRFTDFVFQRVQIRSDGSRVVTSPGGDSPGADASSLSTAQRAIRSPRSVSNLRVPRNRPAAAATATPATASSGVPLVRATSPGAEFREEKRIAAARKENEEKMRRALEGGPSTVGTTTTTTAAATTTTTTDAPGDAPPSLKPSVGHGERDPTEPGQNTPETTPGRPSSLRRFQISRSSTPNLLRGTTSAGVQKRREGGPVAVLVEKLRRAPHSRQASMVADAALAGDLAGGVTVDAAAATSTPARPRKRPVVNKAERKWREDRKTAISAAKEHISETLERQAQTQHQSNWDDESERLAREFEQIALELEGAGDTIDEGDAALTTDYTNSHPSHVPAPVAATATPKPALKYLPRTPNKHRPEPVPLKGPGATTLEHDDESDDGEYVYDTYIRRPLADDGGVSWAMDPATADLAHDHEAWLRRNGVDTTRKDIGLIVITEEDEEYWEHFVVDDEDDEDRWDSEDGDSNAENNPANEYPDEDLSWDDEDDDPAAVYSRYRHRAVSDDEEFDLADSASERGYGNGYGYGRGMRDSDDESW